MARSHRVYSDLADPAEPEYHGEIAESIRAGREVAE
jgi:hypothetical protein